MPVSSSVTGLTTDIPGGRRGFQPNRLLPRSRKLSHSEGAHSPLNVCDYPIASHWKVARHRLQDAIHSMRRRAMHAFGSAAISSTTEGGASVRAWCADQTTNSISTGASAIPFSVNR